VSSSSFLPLSGTDWLFLDKERPFFHAPLFSLPIKEPFSPVFFSSVDCARRLFHAIHRPIYFLSLISCVFFFKLRPDQSVPFQKVPVLTAMSHNPFFRDMPWSRVPSRSQVSVRMFQIALDLPSLSSTLLGGRQCNPTFFRRRDSSSAHSVSLWHK